MVERWLTGEQNKQNYPERPHVALLIVGFFCQNLGSDVAWRSAGSLSELVRFQDSCETEIRDFDDSVGRLAEQ